MIKNRFEEVDEPQPDAITLSFGKEDERSYGTVTCPVAFGAGRLQKDMTSDKLSVIDAFRSAVRIANEMKAPIVVMDPDRLWQAEWGQLYRPED